MPRYVVQRSFPDGFRIPREAEGMRHCLEVVDRNAVEAVTWLNSYVSDDTRRTFCIYEAPGPEAIRKTAARNALPVDSIIEVRVLDPYFYYGGAER